MSDAGPRRAVLLTALLLIVCISCKPSSERKPAATQGGAAQSQATVVRIQTTIGEKKTLHTLVIANGKARSTNELDAWRLFDTKARTVTFVDDAARTIRTESLDALLRTRRNALAAALPPYFPRATIKATGERRAIQNQNATRTLIEAGDYKRELWIAEHSAIPRELFAMMHASDAPSSPLAPMMRAVDETLARTRGFPLIDRTEMKIGDKTLLAERAVVSIAPGSVPATLLQVPRDYKDLTPKPVPPSAAKKKKSK